MKQIKLVFLRILLVLWIAGIFYISLSPDPNNNVPLYKSLSPGTFFLHFLAFFVLFYLFYFSFLFKRKRLFFSFLLSLGISFTKEYAQLLVPARCFGLEDMAIDGGSSFLALLTIIRFGWGKIEKTRGEYSYVN